MQAIESKYEEKLILLSSPTYLTAIILRVRNFDMKTKNISSCLTALLLTSTIALKAQEVAPQVALSADPVFLAHRPPHPPHAGRHLGMPPIAPDQQLIQLTTIKGTVVNALANDKFEYNGLLVKTTNGNISVMFPSHMGEQILAKAKDGATVTVTGVDHYDPLGRKVFRLNSIEVNGTLITDTPPIAPSVESTQEVKTFSANVKELNYSLENNINGFTLSSGERVKVPPHIAQQLGSLLKLNEKIIVTGFVEPKRPGVVYSQKITMVRAQTLNINGQTYLVR